MLPNFSSNVFQTDCGVSGILAGRAVCLTAYQSQISHTFSSISADGRNAIDTPPSGLKKVWAQKGLFRLGGLDRRVSSSCDRQHIAH